MEKLKSRIVTVCAAPMLLAGQAYAAVPESVTTALSDAKTDGVSVAGLVLVAVVAIFAFTLMRRALR